MNTDTGHLFQKVNIYIDYNNTDRVLERNNNNRREVFRCKMATIRNSSKAKYMNTRKESDPFKTMKIPASLLRQLRILAATKGVYLYQLVAELLVREIERKNEEATR